MKNLQEILNRLPQDWKLINKEQYALLGVYSNSEINTIKAYHTKEGNVVTINLYDDKDFISLYDAQLKEIAGALKAKNWKEISSINPLFFGYIEHENCKFYLSVYEAASSSDAVAVQMFYGNENVVGFLTAIKRPKKFTFDYLLENVEVVKNIFSCIK